MSAAAAAGDDDVFGLGGGRALDAAYYYGTPLGAAARKGHADIVRRLLASGWRAKYAVGHRHSNVPALAAAYGHADVVAALLKNSDASGYVPGSQQQALDAAAKRGGADIVRMLLEARLPCDKLAHDKAFLYAAPYGRHEMLQVLHKRRHISADVLSKALYEAADREHRTTVELLLAEYDIDATAEDNE
jgi:ankyrin repeat protein